LKKKFRSFEEARKYARSLKLKKQSDWNEIKKAGLLPKDIPRRPSSVYRNNWKSMGDWLGTGTVSYKNKKWRPFLEARTFVHSLQLKSGKEWAKFTKSKKIPPDIPKQPAEPYKNKGWVSMGNWLGTGRIADQLKKFQTFNDARKYAQSLNLKGRTDWFEFCKSGKRPLDIPSNPQNLYKKQWKGWGDWFGTGTIATTQRKFRSFDEARSFTRKLKIKSKTNWGKFCKSGNLPTDIPVLPSRTYKTEWKGWGDWFGTGTIAPFNREYLPLKEAKKVYQKIAKKYGLKGGNDWLEFIKTHEIPSEIPKIPWHVYSKENVWRRIKRNERKNN